jgi:hypothetical protein
MVICDFVLIKENKSFVRYFLHLFRGFDDPFRDVRFEGDLDP